MGFVFRDKFRFSIQARKLFFFFVPGQEQLTNLDIMERVSKKSFGPAAPQLILDDLKCVLIIIDSLSGEVK